MRRFKFITFILFAFVYLILIRFNIYAQTVNVSGIIDPTVVSFSGETSPNAVVYFIDGSTTLGNTSADNSGNFSTSYSNQSPGDHTYSIYAIDADKVQTKTISFALNLTASKKTDSPSVLLPPTIQANKLIFSGQTDPQANVEIYIDNSLASTVPANSDGSWSKTIDTGSLGNGNHSIYVISELPNNVKSESSEVINFDIPVTSTITITPTAQIGQNPGIIPQIVNKLLKLQSIPNTKNTEKLLQTGGLATGLATGIASNAGLINTAYILANDILIFVEELPVQLFRIILLLLELLGIRSKSKPWGVVYDSVTKQPIDPAIVNLTKLDEPNKGKKETHITDFEGRFGFLVEKGSYRIDITKQGYRFPSQVMTGKFEDEDRKNLYFGNDISFDKADIVNVNIPMDPLAFNWNAANKPIQYKPDKWRGFNKISNAIFIFGFAASIVFYFLDHSIINLILLSLYPVFWLITLKVKRKGWGVVYEQATRKVEPLLTVKAMKEAIKDKFLVLAGLSLTDHLGRYYIILNQGRYILQIFKDTPEGQVMIKQTEPFEVSKSNSLVTTDIGI